MEKKYKYDLYRISGSYSKGQLIKYILRQPKYKIVFWKRICEELYGKKIIYPFARVIYEHYMVKYGVDIGVKTRIGDGFIVGHIGAIAINNQVVLGDNVEILQGVTIGVEKRGKRKGVPKIGNNIWIGSNAVIVGNITIGDNVLIAGNSFVNFDVPSNSIVLGNPGKIIHSDKAVDGYMPNILPKEEIERLVGRMK